ncbi:unnamed protein product, partial [Closterium sp. Naga37s-1]
NVSHNRFSGVVPRGFWTMGSLEILAMAHNQLQGSLPSILDSTALTALDVSENQLHGSLPDSISRLASLQLLNVSGTGLTCPAEGSKCVVKQRNSTSFCRLCFSFCSSCSPRA